MNLSELQIQIDDLKLMLLEPKIFIKSYFEDLINQLDIQTTKFQIEKDEELKNIMRLQEFSKRCIKEFTEGTKEYIEEVDNWRPKILKELNKADNS